MKRIGLLAALTFAQAAAAGATEVTEMTLSLSDAITDRPLYQIGAIETLGQEITLIGGAPPGTDGSYLLSLTEALSKHWGDNVPPTLHGAVCDNIRKMRRSSRGLPMFLMPGQDHVMIMRDFLLAGSPTYTVARDPDENGHHASRLLRVTRQTLSDEFKGSLKNLAIFFDHAARWGDDMAKEKALAQATGIDPWASIRPITLARGAQKRVSAPQDKEVFVVHPYDLPPSFWGTRLFKTMVNSYEKNSLRVPPVFHAIAQGRRGNEDEPESHGTGLALYLAYITAIAHRFGHAYDSDEWNILTELAARVRLIEINEKINLHPEPLPFIHSAIDGPQIFAQMMAFLFGHSLQIAWPAQWAPTLVGHGRRSFIP